MTDVLLIFHFLGLMLGVTGGLGGTVVLAVATPAQKAKGGPIRGIGPALTDVTEFTMIEALLEAQKLRTESGMGMIAAA